jgi:hypothetical protein
MIFQPTIYKRACHWTGYLTPWTIVRIFGLALCLSLGCGSPNAPVEHDTAEIKPTERPPLRVRIVGEPELERELTIRWSAASDQPLQIQNTSLNEAYESSSEDLDVVLFPHQLMGHFVGKDMISKLPNQLLTKVDSILEPERTQAATTSKSKGGESWPAAWRTSGGFGGKLYAVPLGLKRAVALGSDVDWQPIVELTGQLGKAREVTPLAVTHWSTILANLEAKSESRRRELDAKTAELFSKPLTLLESDALVARFLWIASMTDARRKGLFDLNRLENRLNQPDLISAARLFVRIARLNPEGTLHSMETAWNEVFLDASSMAIGRPPINQSDSTKDIDKKSISVAPHIASSGEGYLVAIGAKTKQTNVSIRFLTWLCEREQREAFRKVCSRIDVLPGQFDSASVREDYRAFQAVESKATGLEGMELSLRLANANQYRAALADTLSKAILQPDNIDGLLQECSKRWEAITESLGRESQRISEERSQGFEK